MSTSSQPAPSFTLLLAFLLALLLAQTDAQSPSPSNRPPIVISRGCRNRCYRSRKPAFHDCRHRSRPVAGCHITRCKVNKHRKTPGWICAPTPPPPTPTPSVKPSDRPPIAIPRGCRNRCYRSRGPAFHDCRYRSRPVAGCHITRCKFNKYRKTPGWICAPTNSPSPPPPSPTPSPSPVDLDNSFTARTYRASVRLSDDRVAPATDGSGASYRIKYDVTLPKTGIVSLDGIAEFATVACDEGGTVRVRLSSDTPVDTLQNMYPVGALLIVSRDVYGECSLAPFVGDPDETPRDEEFRTALNNAPLFIDAYLLIESVSGTPFDAVISGTSASYFAMFDKASISIRPVTTTATVRSDMLPALSRAVSLDFDSPLLSLGPLKLTVKGEGAFTGEFVSFDADWGIDSVDLSFVFINEWKCNFNFDAKVSVGAGVFRKTFEVLSIPLWGIPSIDFLSKFDSKRFELPKFKLGFFFEVPLVVTVDAKLEKKLGNVAKAQYKTARTEVTLYGRGSFTGLDVGSNTKSLAPSSSSFDYIPSLSASEPFELSLSAFAGLRPQLAAYVPVFYARASIEVGAELEGKYAPGKSNAFPPLNGGGRQIGICSECHDVEVAGKGVVRNAGLFAGLLLSFKVKVWKLKKTIRLIDRPLVGLTLPGNPSVKVDIATGCYIEPKGDKGPLYFLEEQKKCAECPEDKPRYNPTRKECEEECPDEDKPFFNKATEECEPCPDDAPTYNKKLQICEANCPGGTRAGNDVPFYGSFELGAKNGTFTFQREHFFVKDRMEVLYEGSVIHDTGCTSGSESKSLKYAGDATNVVVKVTPNCEGTTGTAWTFGVSCPT